MKIENTEICIKKSQECFFDFTKDTPFIGDKPFSWWIKKYQLPLHISYAPIIRDNINLFKQTFKEYYPNGGIRFAVKSFPNPQMLKIMLEEKIGVDVASYNETKCALEVGLPPDSIDLNGNCKEDSLLKLSIEKGILIIADSLEEFHLISLIAQKLKKKANVVLRLSGFILKEATADAIMTSAEWSKFGVNVKEIPAFINTLPDHKFVDFLGFHTHIGSQISEVEPFLLVLGQMIELGHLLEAKGISCKIINLGGGFPVSYITESQWEERLPRIKDGYLASKQGDMSKVHVWGNAVDEFALNKDGSIAFDNWVGEKFFAKYPKEKMLEAIFKGEVKVNGKSINAVKALKQLGSPEIIIEPGRSIVGDSGVTLARVSRVRKISFNHNLTTLELGVTNLCESMLFAPIRNWELLTSHKSCDEKPFETFLAGNLCFSADILSRHKVALRRKPSRGDIIMVRDTGAYNSHFLASNANAYPRPARLLIADDGSIITIKKRDTYKQIFS